MVLSKAAVLAQVDGTAATDNQIGIFYKQWDDIINRKTSYNFWWYVKINNPSMVGGTMQH